MAKASGTVLLLIAGSRGYFLVLFPLGSLSLDHSHSRAIFCVVAYLGMLELSLELKGHSPTCETV